MEIMILSSPYLLMVLFVGLRTMVQQILHSIPPIFYRNNGVRDVEVVDIDKDGDLDIFGTSEDLETQMVMEYQMICLFAQ